MTDIQMEEKSSKKKLLVPLVVLMLCAVTLVGAAYAYTTSVSTTSNTLNGEFYSIDLYDGEKEVYTGDVVIGNAIQFVSTKADGAVTVTAATVSAYPICYVAAFLNKDTASNTEAAAIVMAVTSTSTGWTVGNASTADGITTITATHTLGITITFTMGAPSDGYRAISMSASYIQPATSSADAKAITKAASDAVDGFTYGISFTYTTA